MVVTVQCIKCGKPIEAVPSDHWEYYCSDCFKVNLDAIIADTQRAKEICVKQE